MVGWSARRVPLRDSFLDLVLGGLCVGCGQPGRVLCGPCRDALDPAARPAWPTPVPAGLHNPWAASAYDGTVRSMVLGHKEHHQLALARPLGLLLAEAVSGLLTNTGATTVPLVLVPVPPRPSSTRQRGHDPTDAITRVAASTLRGRGLDVRRVAL